MHTYVHIHTYIHTHMRTHTHTHTRKSANNSLPKNIFSYFSVFFLITCFNTVDPRKSNGLILEQLETRTKNSVWNSNKNSKVEPWARHCTASCGSCHRKSTNKNAASWVLLVGLGISASSSPVKFGLKSERLCCLFSWFVSFYFLKCPLLMAPKKVTNVEKPKRKIIMTTVELKKDLSLSGKKIHVYRTWPFSTVFMEYVSPSEQ
jgi:hypothetical protein